MYKVLCWVAVALALLGALLVTDPDNKHVRLVAFILWIFTNSWWMIHNYRRKDLALGTQFLVFLILAIVGVITNW